MNLYIDVITRKQTYQPPRISRHWITQTKQPTTYYQAALRIDTGKPPSWRNPHDILWQCDHKHSSQTSAERCARVELKHQQSSGWVTP